MDCSLSGGPSSYLDTMIECMDTIVPGEEDVREGRLGVGEMGQE